MVKSPDVILRRVLSELKQVKKITKKIKTRKKKRSKKQIAATKKLVAYNKRRN
jgi:hypothetical protein